MEEVKDTNTVVRGIIDRAIASLQAIGMTYEGALQALAVQSTLLMSDTADTRRWLKHLANGLVNDGDEAFVQ